MWKQKQNKLNKKLKFLGSAQEQACMGIIKPMCVGKNMRTQVLAQKTLKTKPSLKH